MGEREGFVGLRLEPGGRLTAYLVAGVVRLVPTEADLKRPAGWYLDNWTPVPDPTTGKLAKGQVCYGPGRAGSRCGVCEHFEAPDGCARVAGAIDHDAWCELFKHELLAD